jgi:hypothetical protein
LPAVIFKLQPYLFDFPLFTIECSIQAFLQKINAREEKQKLCFAWQKRLEKNSSKGVDMSTYPQPARYTPSYWTNFAVIGDLDG